MGIWNRLIFVTALLLTAALSVDAYFAYTGARANAVESLLTQAEKIRGVIMATRRVYHRQFLESKIPLTDETLGFLPAHALSKVSKDFGNWDSSGVSFNNVSDWPRNLDNMADSEEMKAIDYFRNDSSQLLYFEPFKKGNGESYYLYARPIRVEPYCLECHGKRETAPPTIRDNYTTAFDYKVGDLRGVLSIKLPARVIENAAMKDFIREVTSHLTIFLGMFILIFYTVRKYVTKPLSQISDGMGEIAAGHYESRLSGFKGELADIEQSFNTMAEEIAKQRSLITSSKDEAEKANKAKSEFLASMSHELRTPMNAVLGFAQMLQFDPQAPLSPAQNERVQSILEGGGQLLKLVNQIFDLAKIEADQISLSLEAVNVNEVTAICVRLIRPHGEPNGITIFNKLDDRPLPPLRTDPDRLKQVLLNLLSNAVKYNKKGGTVTVDAKETFDGFLHISVKDTGHGIAKDNYSGVFQTFNRLHIDPTIAKEGTGIGLSVSKMLVEQMSGRMGFESEIGICSTFWFELPLASNEDVLIWTDSLRVGVDAIDRDHQTLISLTNKISTPSIEKNKLDEIVEKLINYTHYHFRREEVIMEVCGYPDLGPHRDFHKSLAVKINQLSESWRKEQKPQTLRDLRKFMRDWLIVHIKHEDAKIVPYAKGKGEDIAKALENLKSASNITFQTIASSGSLDGMT